MGAPPYQGTQAPAAPIDRSKLIKQLQDSLSGEANLTPQELQDRLAQYQQLSGLPQQQTGPDIGRLAGDIARRYGELTDKSGVEQTKEVQGAIQKASFYAANQLLGGQPYNPKDLVQNIAQIVQDTVGQTSRGKINIDPLQKAANDTYNEFRPSTTLSQYQLTNDIPNTTSADQYAPDIKRLQDFLTTKNNLATSDTAAQASIASLPAELAHGTNAFVQNQTDQAGQFLEQQLAPQIAQSENMRGILYSGDLANELSRGAAGAYAPVENAQATLQAQDRDFYTNAAYNYQLAKSLNAGQDLALQTAQDRNSALTNQGYNFQSGQADIQRQLQERLLNQQQQSSLIAQNAAIRQQQDALQRQNRAGLASGIGSSVGAIGGGIIGGIATGGNPLGIAAGVSLGGSIGNQGGTVAGSGLARGQ